MERTDEFRLLTAVELERLYREDMTRDFPSAERKPLPCLLKLMAEGRYEPYALFRDGSVLAYALYWKADSAPYKMLDYYAVRPAGRNQGLGGALLGEMLARFCDGAHGVFLEAELPVSGDEAADALRRRRLGFYQRCGLRRAGYTTDIFTVPYAVLLYGPEISDEGLLDIHRAVYRTAFSGEDYGRNIFIPAEEKGGLG